MSYDLELYFRNSEFPIEEWLEILSWFGAIEKTLEPEWIELFPYRRQEWFIPVGSYGIFCSLNQSHPCYRFEDHLANWSIFIDTGSGLGLRQFIGFTLCYCVLSLIPSTSVWDLGQFLSVLYQEPDKFLEKVNSIINPSSLYSTSCSLKLSMQQMGVLDQKFRLIPDPNVLINPVVFEIEPPHPPTPSPKAGEGEPD